MFGRFVVRKLRSAIVPAILLAVTVAGCGGNDGETATFKQTDTSQFKGMLDKQSQSLKGAKKAPVTPPTPPK
jgi:hypothetical protein